MKYFKSNGGFDLSLIDLRNFMQNMLEFGYISPIMLTRRIISINGGKVNKAEA